jgi:hypothetical protein
LPVFDLLLGEQIHVEIVENEGMDDVETVVRKTIEKYPVSGVRAGKPWAICGTP